MIRTRLILVRPSTTRLFHSTLPIMTGTGGADSPSRKSSVHLKDVLHKITHPLDLSHSNSSSRSQSPSSLLRSKSPDPPHSPLTATSPATSVRLKSVLPFCFLSVYTTLTTLLYSYNSPNGEPESKSEQKKREKAEQKEKLKAEKEKLRIEKEAADKAARDAADVDYSPQNYGKLPLNQSQERTSKLSSFSLSVSHSLTNIYLFSFLFFDSSFPTPLLMYRCSPNSTL